MKNARYMTHLQGMKTAYPRTKVSDDLTYLLKKHCQNNYYFLAK